MSFDKDKSGAHDFGQVLKNSYRESESAIDVITNGTSLVPHKFTRLALTKNTDCLTTQVDYYNDDISEVSNILTTADTSGNLNNKYFVLYSGRDGTKYHVWFNVSSGGTDPAPASSTGIEVAISTDDTQLVVATALKLVLDSHTEFSAVLKGTHVIITANVPGVTTNTSDNDTSFTFSTETEGAATLVATLLLTYDSHNKLIGIERR